jgi:hypothetical protein
MILNRDFFVFLAAEQASGGLWSQRVFHIIIDSRGRWQPTRPDAALARTIFRDRYAAKGLGREVA